MPAVYADWPARARPLGRVAPRELAALALDAGTMGPKVEAACAFARAGRGVAAIGALADAERLLRGEAGTVVRAGRPSPTA